MFVAWFSFQGCQRTTNSNVQVPLKFGVKEMEEAVVQIEIGETTREDVDALFGPYVESRGLYRLKDTGGNRDYFFVVGDRQIWIDFSIGDDGVETVLKMGELVPRAEYIQRWEGGYLTFDPTEEPW